MRIITPLQPSLDSVQSALNSVGEGDMGESVSELEGGGQDEAIQLLASQGNTMLPEDPPTFTHTEAGKLALLSSSQPLPLVKCEIKIESPIFIRENLVKYAPICFLTELPDNSLKSN